MSGEKSVLGVYFSWPDFRQIPIGRVAQPKRCQRPVNTARRCRFYSNPATAVTVESARLLAGSCRRHHRSRWRRSCWLSDKTGLPKAPAHSQ
ncbi:hypothetical protein KCP69_21550 [Salmonella enterica subsp. enterica]|nr:hypothetical protein KCP69_21550 [Salmonella enterica subsp. enterica]